MTDDNDIRVPVRYFNLQAGTNDDFDPDDGPWTFNGIAVGIGDILHMEDGTPVLMTEEELRRAAATQAGEPVTADHPTDESTGRPKYPPDTDETFGKVPKADFIEGKGVGYEMTVHDEELARGLYAGSYEVSVHPRFGAEERDPATGALIAENIEFLDLSVVSKGDSPSNTVNWGASQELAAWAHDNDISSELTAGDDDADLDIDDDSAKTLLSKAASMVGLDLDRFTVQADDEPAESGSDSTTDMDNGKIETLVDEHDFDEESLEAMEEDDLDRLHESLVDGDGKQQNQGGNNDDSNTVEVDLGDHDSFDDYIDSRVEDQVAASKAEIETAEMVEEIIAHSDDFEEDDREDLMASSESVLEQLHDQATTTSAAQLPGSVGRQSAVAGAGGGEDADEFKEIVAELSGNDGGGE